MSVTNFVLQQPQLVGNSKLEVANLLAVLRLAQLSPSLLPNILNYSAFKIEIKGRAGPEGPVDEQMRRQIIPT